MADSATEDRESIVIPAFREDLNVTRQKFESRTYYVIKDPISLQYYRLGAEDYFLATLFDGKHTFAQIRALYLQQYPHIRLEASDEEIDEKIMQFANDLSLMQLLIVQGAKMKQRFETTARARQQKGGFSQLVSKLFFSRFSVYDPDELFGKMAKPLWWIWTKPTLWISIFLVIAAVVVFIANYGRIAPSMSEFFSLQNLAMIWVATIIIKSIHELGHGLTCKHLGSEVHEVGIMLLVFTPYFFVNVSDSWVLPKRTHRILISAAGIYVELIIAAFAVFLWAVVQPGPLQQMLFNIIIIASFSTIVFNANPLMRFDGYYILMDLLETPNLSTKSRAFIGQKVKRLLFGKNYEDPALAKMPLPRKRLGIFYFYAIASYIYGYFVIYQLTRFMAARLEPYGLKTVGEILSVSAVLAWVVFPLYMFFKGLKLNREDWKPQGRLRRLSWIGGSVLFGFLLLCCLPHSLEIRRSLAIEPASPETIRPIVNGFIAEVFVKEGQEIAPGTAVAKLNNREVEQNYFAQDQRLRIAEAMLRRAMGLDRPSDLRQAENTKKQAESKFAEAKKDYENLTLRSQSGGLVLTRDLRYKKGQLIKSGELFCEVAPRETIRIRVPLSEHQVRYVKKGQEVRIKAAAYPGETFVGIVDEDPVALVGKEMPPTFSKNRQGDVPTGMDREGHEMPLQRTFEAHVRIQNRDGLLRQGMSGRAEIAAGTYLYGRLVLQSLLDLVSLDYRF